MPLEIQSTRLVEQAERTATIEIVIADAADVSQASEYVLIRTAVSTQSGRIPAVQLEALDKAREILNDLDGRLRQKWGRP